MPHTRPALAIGLAILVMAGMGTFIASRVPVHRLDEPLSVVTPTIIYQEVVASPTPVPWAFFEPTDRTVIATAGASTLFSTLVPAGTLARKGAGLSIRVWFDEFSITHASQSADFDLVYGGDSVGHCIIDAWQPGRTGWHTQGFWDIILVSGGPALQYGQLAMIGGGANGESILVQQSGQTNNNLIVSCEDEGFGAVDTSRDQVLKFTVNFTEGGELDRFRQRTVLIKQL